MDNAFVLLLIALAFFLFVSLAVYFSNSRGLGNIKSKTVGDGQHGTARFITRKEIRQHYHSVPYTPDKWRKGENLPSTQGIILGSVGRKKRLTALVDADDIHCLMIGAAGVGKTAFFLYPNLEYACASGMSFITTDTKGDLFRNYGGIAKEHYGYNISVIDLRNPTQSNGNNLLHLVNRYMDQWKEDTTDIRSKSKAEKYAKIIAKSIITASGDNTSYGQNAFFYDSAEGLLTATILLLAEFVPPIPLEDGSMEERRHIVSVFKLIQDLMAPEKHTEKGKKAKSKFQRLMEYLPDNHKAKWYAGAALNSADQAMASVFSTAMSRLNAFLDTELEQILCFQTEIDAEQFVREKSAIFLVLPEEDNTKYFIVSLFLQQFYGELLAVADEYGGTLPNRVAIYADELGTLPKITSLEQMFSAGRSRKIMMVPIIQSFAQLERNYGKEGAEIITDNCQDTIFGGFAPQSKTAESLSKSMGNYTVLSGSVNRGRNDPSQSLQMMSRPLMTADELKSIPKGQFVVMKTSTHPMKARLPLFLDWGITFDTAYTVPHRPERPVAYVRVEELEEAIQSAVSPPHAERSEKVLREGIRLRAPLEGGESS